MSELRVRSSSGEYPIHLARGSFDALLDRLHDPILIADERFRDRVGDRPAAFVTATEANKTVAEGARLIEALHALGARRGTPVVALGGGIVQDVATLTASLYMRGLPWAYAPTTLASMADSCIGGKSSINVGAVKNLAGNFFPPREVAIDPDFIATLAPADIVNGLAEAAKIAYCRGAEAYERYEQLAAAFAFGADLDAGAQLLEHVLKAKTWFIEVDEFDRAERRLLNLGHTFGHALEAAVGHRVQHGVAVALGVRAAITTAREHDGRDGVLRARLDAHCAQLAGDVPGLGAALGHFDRAAFTRALLGDKKHTQTELRLILPLPEGGAQEIGLPRDQESNSRLLTALQGAMGEVR